MSRSRGDHLLEGLSRERCLGDLPRVELATFVEQFSRQREPVVVTGVADAWPARDRWTHEYLEQKLGVEVGTSKALTPELAAEVAFPEVARIVQQTNVWFVPDGTVTQLHYDLPHNLNTVLGGEKDVFLFHPRETRNLHPHSSFDADGPLNSRVRLDDVEPRFGRVRRARYWAVTVRPGETLYIPPFFWHFVRSRGESVSVNVWFHVDPWRLRRIARWPRAAIVRAAFNVLRRRMRSEE